MTKGACHEEEKYDQTMFPFPLMPKGERSFVERGSLFRRGFIVFSSIKKGDIVGQFGIDSNGF